jgi:hypothetical protein
MELSDDFSALFDAFNAHRVEYLIVGSYQDISCTHAFS